LTTKSNLLNRYYTAQAWAYTEAIHAYVSCTLHLILLASYYLSDQNKDNKIGDKYIQNFGSLNLKGRKPGGEWRKILNGIFKDVMFVSRDLIQEAQGTYCCEHGNEPSVSAKSSEFLGQQR
jgi:hypothetical protein